jgi:hypothetical protein
MNLPYRWKQEQIKDHHNISSVITFENLMQLTENLIGYVLIVHITVVYVCANSAHHSSLCCSFDFSSRDLKKSLLVPKPHK